MMSSVRLDTGEDISGCPDDETLAVYLEGGLELQERARLEAHVSDCDRCLELLSLLAPQQPEVDGGKAVVPVAGSTFPPPSAAPVTATPPASSPVTAPPDPVGRGPRWFLPAAAALVVVLGGAALVWQTRARAPGIAELRDAAALGASPGATPYRLTHGSLAGFPYAEQPPVLRSADRAASRVGAAVLDAAAAVERARSGRSDAASRHAYGVALLIAGDLAGATTNLAQASAASPDDPRLANDAAVAWLEKAHQQADPAAIAEARRFAEQATRLAPDMAEAWFNLAQVAVLTDDGALKARAVARLEALPQASAWLAEIRDVDGL